ncbi:hypothetical protein HNR44_000527 [Geomicrobium halophilum]|uniref:Uncharacterized protein n=1 Tax=Geomicrobium halophilum TaxID=549000 RepID=A0A841Q033_9BACL|nr:hypothetical protein [Geomicrobium halophilum]MBB6448578.1 hypothetical protein [Geomicrobium halophilum]
MNRKNRKEHDPLRVEGEGKAKFKPGPEEDTDDMLEDPIPDEELKYNEREEKDKRKSKNDSLSEE